MVVVVMAAAAAAAAAVVVVVAHERAVCPFAVSPIRSTVNCNAFPHLIHEQQHVLTVGLCL